MNHSEFYPYPSRPGSGSTELSFDIESSNILSEEQLTAVLGFEKDLYDLSLSGDQFPKAERYKQDQEGLGRSIETLEKTWSSKINTTTLGVRYFATEQGRVALQDSLNVAISDSASLEEIESTLANLNTRNIDSKILNKLQASSIGYEEGRITKQFIDNNFSGESIDAPDMVLVFKNPEEIVKKANGYRQIKVYLTNVMSDLRSQTGDPEVTKARLVITESIRRRVNMFLLDTYVQAYKLYGQNRKTDAAYGESVDELEAILPAFNTAFSDERIAQFMQRIDRMQQGVSTDEDGTFTFLSPEAKALAASAVDKADDSREVDRGDYEMFSPEDFNNTKISGDVFGEWAREVLSSYGVLSQSTDWNSEREGPAEDGKWQVIVDDMFKSLEVKDAQRVMTIPKGEVYTLLKALPLVSHEVVHVLQHENKRAIGDMEMLKRIGFDNPSEQTESGGKWQEAEAREKLTGKTDTDVPGTSYLKALLVKEQGGSFGQAVQAFYEDFRMRMPNDTPEEVAKKAVNRTRRIYRGGGFEFAQQTDFLTDTQPLNYLEQQLIYESLGEKERKLLYLGGVAIATFVRMADVGLVDASRISIPDKKPLEILFDRVGEQIRLQKDSNQNVE